MSKGLPRIPLGVVWGAYARHFPRKVNHNSISKAKLSKTKLFFQQLFRFGTSFPSCVFYFLAPYVKSPNPHKTLAGATKSRVGPNKIESKLRKNYGNVWPQNPSLKGAPPRGKPIQLQLKKHLFWRSGRDSSTTFRSILAPWNGPGSLLGGSRGHLWTIFTFFSKRSTLGEPILEPIFHLFPWKIDKKMNQKKHGVTNLCFTKL